MNPLIGRFQRDVRGSVALMFGLVAVVLMGVVGVAFDYSRAALVQTNLQRAVDATVLYAAKNRDQSDKYKLSNANAAKYMQNTFDAEKLDDFKVNVTISTSSVRIDASGSLKTTIANVLGFRTMPVAGSAEALYSQKVEVALVLDNTGSMMNLNKLETLKGAANRFLDKMQEAVTTSDSVKVALVPFDTNVNLGALKAASWVDGSASSFWRTHPDQAGCIWDRDQPYDTQATAPTGAARAFYADTSRAGPCALAPILPLTTDFTALHAAVNAMVGAGNTNTTIGLAWGLHVLTPTLPINTAAPAAAGNVSRYMIFMTDGLNTQNRWTVANDDPVKQAAIDVRTALVCDSIRQAGIQLFVARIMEGNATLLSQCATTPDMYFEISDVAQFDPVFTRIYSRITGMRLAR